MRYADVDEETGKKAVEYYRERYSVTGIYENRLYPGVEKMLSELKQKGYRLAIASSKPEYYILQILDYFRIYEYFDVIVGSEMNGGRTRKSEVIEEALRLLKLENHRDQVVMVGDKEHDVLGAREAGVSCIAVTYGYGTEEELDAAEPMAKADSTESLIHFFA
jgi:phosphoglycolate phosphatase